jgi:hypothetical protein
MCLCEATGTVVHDHLEIKASRGENIRKRPTILQDMPHNRIDILFIYFPSLYAILKHVVVFLFSLVAELDFVQASRRIWRITTRQSQAFEFCINKAILFFLDQEKFAQHFVHERSLAVNSAYAPEKTEQKA